MKFSTFSSLFVLTIVYSLVIQVHNQECTCGGLGQGTNPCTCSEVVVKAAELPKPTYYVSPEEVKSAASTTVIVSTDSSQNSCSNSQSASNTIIYSPDSDSSSDTKSNTVTYSINTDAYSNSNTCGCNGQSKNTLTNTDSNAQSKSGTIIYTESNPTSSSGSSVVYKTDVSYSDNSNTPIYTNSNPIGSSGSSVIYKTDVSYSDNSNAPIYTNSNPIGSSGSSVVYETDVSYSDNSNTPIYTNSNPTGSTGSSVVYETDVSYSGNSNVPNSGCNCNKQNIETLEIDDSTNINGNIVPRFSPIGDLCYPLPMEPRTGKLIEKIRVTPAYPGKVVCCPPSVPYEICINTVTGETRSNIIQSGSADVTDKITVTTIGNNGVITGVTPQNSVSFGASKIGSYESMNSGTLGSVSIPFSGSVAGSFGEAASGSLSGSKTTFTGLYNLPLAYANLNIGNGQKQYLKTIVNSGSSDCFDDVSGDAEVDNSYPAIPADAVSLTLAYKNLRAPNVVYRKGKQFVPEDKLSFGHRTIPADVKNENQILDIAEEKLVTVNKPVVELKLAPPKTVVIGSYDEQEEAKLAELEAIERESITQEETADQIAESLITYKDLGYAPVGATYTKSMSLNQGIMNGKLDDSAEEPCGPLGPPVPGYIPGAVIVQEQQIMDDSSSNFGISDINGNIEIQASGSDPCPK
ncbi:uncharacterized protein LOC143429320 [Xylocopa sonorina]|uniref:uncharacterized protein LOC143429320 n=1 Tax=Xylocopa sonorina TaxID=1818115 RepID=UPI00403B3397